MTIDYWTRCSFFFVVSFRLYLRCHSTMALLLACLSKSAMHSTWEILTSDIYSRKVIVLSLQVWVSKERSPPHLPLLCHNSPKIQPSHPEKVSYLSGIISKHHAKFQSKRFSGCREKRGQTDWERFFVVERARHTHMEKYKISDHWRQIIILTSKGYALWNVFLNWSKTESDIRYPLSNIKLIYYERVRI